MRALTAQFKLSTVGSVQFLPVNLFASVMGFSGLSLAWREASQLFGTPVEIADICGMVAVVLFMALSIGYLSKCFLYPRTVKEEFKHPISGNFFGTITISVLLLSSVVGRYFPLAGQACWIAGTATTLTLSFVFVSRILTGHREPGHTVPAMLVPVVGTLDIAVAGGTMPFSWTHEINLLSLAIGGFIAFVYFTLILSRLVHQAPLPAGITPSLLILIAPFEVGFLGYSNVAGRVDSLASALFYFGLFLFAVLFFKVFNKSIPFGASWWGVGFPMAALSIAALKYALLRHAWPFTLLSAAVLGLLSIVLAVLLYRTLGMLLAGKLLAGK
ncbi:SLAC1 anion channel family protein [Cohnella rhizosphaerae]|uniref:SLAC1 anion channel family protein n=1 Tax=Cohnella rhizosphaerae TaxID=1457232 RepID=A0A9X4QWT0_9BACL|nr:SLAC1 anion channel family protein [Cohnella rhizosphaerae]MDG0812682.1 SLAC1 anion channel family protein [Cohnella rhizosphaerae]